MSIHWYDVDIAEWFRSSLADGYYRRGEVHPGLIDPARPSDVSLEVMVRAEGGWGAVVYLGADAMTCAAPFETAESAKAWAISAAEQRWGDH